MNYAWHDVLGIAGVALVLVSYLLVQMQKLGANTQSYTLSNALGACLILVSLTRDFNLSAFLIESSWLLISLYGFARSFAAK